jgi:peptidyl-prolyl cis-trans isomerase SurA
MIRSVIFSLVLVPALARAQDSTVSPRPTRIDHIVGVVQNEPILRSEVREAVEQLVAQGVRPRPTDSTSERALMRLVLDSIVDARLLDIAARDAKVEVNEEQVASAVEGQIEQIRAQFTNDSVFRIALRHAGFATVEAFRAARIEAGRLEFMRGQYIQQLRTDGKLPIPTVTEEDIVAIWEENRASFGRYPGGYTWRQIVLPVQAKPEAKAAARAKAESLYFQITRLPDPERQLALFDSLARRESMDGTREQGGDLGFQRRGSLVAEFERWAFLLPVNTVSPVFETVFGYHILRVDRVQSAQVRVRHIVITPQTDSTDVARTIALADTIATALRAGASFDSLASRYHDPAELRSRPTPIPADSLVAEYANAVRGLKPGDIAKPFVYPNPNGQPRVRLVIVTGFEEERDRTIDDVRNGIRSELEYRKSLRRLLDELRKEYYVSIRL